jgi:hypothetical protein
MPTVVAHTSESCQTAASSSVVQRTPVASKVAPSGAPGWKRQQSIARSAGARAERCSPTSFAPAGRQSVV